MLLPLPVAAQEVRARDLSIVENVLVDTVQQAIETTVRTVNTENLQAQETARANNEPLPIRYVFRTGTHTQARGMFLEGYGAIFTVQVPAMSYTTSLIYTLGGRVSASDPRSLQEIIASAGALGEQFQLRTQTSRMESEIAVWRERLEAEVASNGAESDTARALRASLQAMQQAFGESQRLYGEVLAERERDTQEAAAERRRGVSRNDLGAGAGSGDDERAAAYRRMTAATREEIAAAEALAQDQRNQIEGAVIDAVIETLSQYGRIMHGLADNDRLAVVLLPSSYLTPMSWARATQRDEEFIISVRFRDVMDLDRGNLGQEEFRGRVRIEGREGTPAGRQSPR